YPAESRDRSSPGGPLPRGRPRCDSPHAPRYQKPSQRQPRRDKRNPTDRRDRTEHPVTGNREKIKAAREDHDPHKEQPANQTGREVRERPGLGRIETISTPSA